MEIWKYIENFTNKYEINTKGEIRNVKNKKLLTPYYNKGYKRIGLYLNGKKYQFSIHRLVATTFIPNPSNKPFVNHIDGIKDNNNLENLEWNTELENSLNYLNSICTSRKAIIKDLLGNIIHEIDLTDKSIEIITNKK